MEDIQNKQNFTKEQIVEEMNANVKLIKQKILETDASRTKAKEILDLLRFYIGNETIQIKMTMIVNLHQVKSENLLSTKVVEYRKILESSIEKATIEIEAYGNTLEKIAETLVKKDEIKTDA